ncbi:hypothetical protein ACVWZA_000138 [Sphingomonas sp. UYAg733]
MNLTLEQDGAVRCGRAALSSLVALDALADRQPPDRAGIRLQGVDALAPLLASEGPLGALTVQYLGAGCRPVRAILFDKTEATNWALGWHQDRTIVVRERRETPGFGPWTVKAGMTHVAPPAELLAGMVTMRVHLDAVPADNAPLLIAPGSHRLGRIAEPEIDAVVERCGTIACLAQRGDVWLYATLILHASEVAARPRRRRVLQIDFAAGDLPGALEWFGL